MHMCVYELLYISWTTIVVHNRDRPEIYENPLIEHTITGLINPFTATSSDALYNASEKTFYQITHTIHLLETTYKIIPYRLGKPKTFLD